MFAYCVPVDAGQTDMIIAGTRNFGRYNPLVRLLDEVNRLVIAEDKAIVESSQPEIVPEPRQELSVASDRPTLAFRTWYLRELAPSEAATVRFRPAGS
jgi:hypothetical protein